MSDLILLAAGGTGGHLFPARALALDLRRRGHELALITDSRGADYSRLFEDVPIYRVRAASPSGRGLFGKLSAAINLVIGVAQAWIIERRLAPAAVVGFGGYPSLPGVVAAVLTGRPRILHEQNAVLGRVNKMLAPRVQAIATSFIETLGIPERPGQILRDTGNPVRREVAEAGATEYHAPNNGTVELLIFGGSQGAAAFARTIPAALAILPDTLRSSLRVTQQCRPEDLDVVTATYADVGITATCQSFFDDLPERLAASHLVIARAGAGSVSELATVGRPSLLVPYPHAMDDHQSYNAQALVNVGGAWTVQERDLCPESLCDLLQDLLTDPTRLEAAARAAKTVAPTNAAALLADLVEEVAA